MNLRSQCFRRIYPAYDEGGLRAEICQMFDSQQKHCISHLPARGTGTCQTAKCMYLFQELVGYFRGRPVPIYGSLNSREEVRQERPSHEVQYLQVHPWGLPVGERHETREGNFGGMMMTGRNSVSECVCG